MKKQGYYTTGEFAEKAHVTLRTIRGMTVRIF